VIAHLSRVCEITPFVPPLLQYLEEFALQAQTRTMNEAQLDYFQRINHFALQVCDF